MNQVADESDKKSFLSDVIANRIIEQSQKMTLLISIIGRLFSFRIATRMKIEKSYSRTVCRINITIHCTLLIVTWRWSMLKWNSDAASVLPRVPMRRSGDRRQVRVGRALPRRRRPTGRRWVPHAT